MQTQPSTVQNELTIIGHSLSNVIQNLSESGLCYRKEVQRKGNA